MTGDPARENNEKAVEEPLVPTPAHHEGELSAMPMLKSAELRQLENNIVVAFHSLRRYIVTNVIFYVLDKAGVLTVKAFSMQTSVSVSNTVVSWLVLRVL